MDFEWDGPKAKANLRKHGVDFADAATLFRDEHAITIADDEPDEERYVTIGKDAIDRTLVVVYTVRGECIRLISARHANARERAEYERE